MYKNGIDALYKIDWRFALNSIKSAFKSFYNWVQCDISQYNTGFCVPPYIWKPLLAVFIIAIIVALLLSFFLFLFGRKAEI